MIDIDKEIDRFDKVKEDYLKYLLSNNDINKSFDIYFSKFNCERHIKEIRNELFVEIIYDIKHIICNITDDTDILLYMDFKLIESNLDDVFYYMLEHHQDYIDLYNIEIRNTNINNILRNSSYKSGFMIETIDDFYQMLKLYSLLEGVSLIRL